MDTTTVTVLKGLRWINVNLLIIAVSMVMLTFASSPIDLFDNEYLETKDDGVYRDSSEMIPSHIKCVFIAPEDSENSPIRRKRSGSDDKFRSSVFGLANYDLMTTILDKKPRKQSSEIRPEAVRQLMQLMIKNGR